MAELPYYPHYTGDYNKKTAHLTLAEHGAYRLLMDHYYATQSPLPMENDVLFRICRVVKLQEKRIILSIISQFFYEKDGKYFHKKIEEILVKRLEYSKSQSAKAYARHNAEKMPARVASLSSSLSKKKESKKSADAPQDFFEELKAGKEYFWQGKAIALTETTYNQYKKICKGVSLDSFLESEDEYISGLPPDNKLKNDNFFYLMGKLKKCVREKQALAEIGM